MVSRVAALNAWQHLETAEHYGLLHPIELQTGLLRLAAMLGKPADVRHYATIVSAHLWDQAPQLAELGGYRAAAGDVAGGVRDLRRALELEPNAEPIRVELERVLAVQQQQQALH